MKKKNKNSKLKRPPILFDKTQKKVREVKKACHGDFITYWTSNNSSMSESDLVVFYRLLKDRIKADTLYMFIKSDGGSGKTALRIIHLLRRYYKKIVVLVPLNCASAGTMLALGADVIKMGPIAYLTAIDTSITHDLSPVDNDNDRVSVNQTELDRVLKLWDSKKEQNDQNPYTQLYQYIHPLVFGSVDRASSLSIKLTTEILTYHLDDVEKAERISTHLNSDYPSHSYPITSREAARIGLHVEELDKEANDLLIQLSEYYSEMAQRAYSDYDELNYHDNEILSIIEMEGEQIFYQKDKDWHYRKEERKWVPMNDNSSWRRVEKRDGEVQVAPFFIR
ncbi:MAG: hypothetical protein KDD19_07140 [Phaeodactylibacter sp.]|nr:hypothetical protein [Phaeodactylibacter sp.]